jgi:uncharacterized protein (DUF58 family)
MISRAGLVGIIGLLLAGILLRNGLLFIVGLMLLLAVALTWLWERVCLRGVEHRRWLSQRRAFFGEEIELVVEVVNRKLLPLPWLVVDESLPSELAPAGAAVTPSHTAGRSLLRLVLALRPYERVRRHYRIHCGARGEHIFGPTTLRSGDIFGFTTREQALPVETRLLIYPRVVPVEELGLPSRDPFGDVAVRQWLFQDPLRTVGVRDYVPGDSPRRIHWAATARRQALQVKLFEPTTTFQLILMLNLNTHGEAWWWPTYLPDPLETLIMAAASVAAWAVERGDAVGLYANASLRYTPGRLRLPPGRDPAQLTHILESLARIVPFASLPLERLLALEHAALPFGATVVAVTAVLNEAILAELQALHAAGHPVALLLVGEHPPLTLPGIRIHRLGEPARWRELETLAPAQTV